jgi:LCP family protein required for cell wall assembly
VSVAAPDIPGLSGWKPLARGGFATVWQARQESLDRLVAVKVDRRTLDTEAEQRRFLSEAKTAGGLSGHPGIVTVHDAGVLHDGRPYLVMKLCPGGSLTRWQNPDNRQSDERVRKVGVDIADTLAAAHAQGMLHRDVKPANILIDDYGNAGLADFGLAGPVQTGSGEGITPAYAPPEVLRGEPATEASDVYQLAATLYAVLGGEPPHGQVEPDASLDDVVARLDEPVPPLPGVDPGLMQVLIDALANDPEHRPSAAGFRDRLAALELGPVDVRRRRRHRALLVGVLALATVLVVLISSAGVYLYEIDRSVTANISRGIVLPNYPDRPVKPAAAVDTLDYVLIGTDDGDPQRDNEGRSDSVMLVHLNQARDKAYVVSFPRDLWVDIPGRGPDTLNAAYENKDAALVVRTIESLTKTPVDHVATIDFEGFVSLTDDLGGVTVDNPRAFVTPGRSFPAGRITISGQDALWFVRERHSLPNERARAANQRLVLKAILTKALSSEVLANPKRLTQFAGNAAKRLRVDNGLSNTELRSTALSLRLSSNDITMLGVPTSTTKKDGKAVEVVDAEQFAELSDALRTGRMDAYVKTYPKG